MADINSQGSINNTFTEELQEYDDIDIKYEPKYAEVMQESFFENNNFTSNTIEAEPLDTYSNSNSNVDSSNMIISLRIKSEEKDYPLNNMAQPNNCVVNNTEKLQENVIQPLIYNISDSDESCSGFATTQNKIIQKSIGTSCQYILNVENKKDSNVGTSIRGSNELNLDLNTGKIDAFLMKNQSNFSFSQCPCIATCPTSLKRHQKSHQTFGNMSCEGCGSKSTPSTLRHHQYECDTYLFKKHLLQSHKNEDQPYPKSIQYQRKCEACKSNSSQNKSKEKLSNLRCPKCPYATTRPQNLKLHVKSHREFQSSPRKIAAPIYFLPQHDELKEIPRKITAPIFYF